MKSRTSLIVSAVLSLSCAVVFAGLINAETGKEVAKVNVEESAKNGQPDQSMTSLTLSAELATVARDKKDPILMLAAAHLESMAKTEEAQRAKTSEGEETAGGDKEKTEQIALYALAEEYAGSNETLLALIGGSKDSVSVRGLPRGPKVSHDTVLAGRTDTYRLTFMGNEYAEVAVLGDGDTDLDLYVYDENGNQICKDIDPTDRAYCSWIPRWTGEFRIVIRNEGGVYNNYALYAN